MLTLNYPYEEKRNILYRLQHLSMVLLRKLYLCILVAKLKTNYFRNKCSDDASLMTKI